MFLAWSVHQDISYVIIPDHNHQDTGFGSGIQGECDKHSKYQTLRNVIAILFIKISEKRKIELRYTIFSQLKLY